ncbi:MAG: hypothetical protein HFH13_04230 [Dorea sp.]|nr:hypothetical protein [Dorea sp.]
MITRQMLFPLAFYQKAKFHGSKGKYNYRIEKYMGEEGEEAKFRLSVWEGPECYDASKKEKTVSLYDFSEDGMEEIREALNQLVSVPDKSDIQ